MAASGVTAVCLTPHLTTRQAEQGVPPAHDGAFGRLQAAAPGAVTLYRGVELMLDMPFPESATANAALRLGGSRYVLVEFSAYIARAAGRSALARMVSLGLIPLVAHPERYACCAPDVIAEWKAAGARIQLDATTMLMPRTRGHRVRTLLAEGLGDILAADNHGDGRMLPTAYTALCEHGAMEQATQLVRGNPAAILADEPTVPVEPVIIPESLLAKLRRLFKPEE